MNHTDLGKDVLDKLQWTDAIWNHVKTAVHDEAVRLNKVRPLLPLFGDQNLDPDSIVSYRIDAGPPLSIATSDRLVSVDIASEFVIHRDNFGDEGIALTSLMGATTILIFAEETILLLGANAGPKLKKLNIRVDDRPAGDYKGTTLEKQMGLFGKNRIDGRAKVIDSILAAITKLHEENQYGDYCAIVSPDLYAQAGELIDGTQQISLIERLLMKDGFKSSPALDTGEGVVFVKRDGIIDIAVPMDAMVTFVRQDSEITLSVEERFTLRLNDPRAVVSFGPSNGAKAKNGVKAKSGAKGKNTAKGKNAAKRRKRKPSKPRR